MERLEKIIDKLDQENQRKSTLLENLKSQQELQFEEITTEFSTQRTAMQDDVKRKSKKISQLVTELKKTEKKLEESEKIKRMYIERTKNGEKRVRELERELAKTLDEKNRFGKENRELRANLGFREKSFLTKVKEMRSEMGKLQSSLKVEKENNATLLNTLNQNQISNFIYNIFILILF